MSKRRSTIPIPKDIRICHFYNVVENEAHFVLKCPLYNSVGDRFSSIFQDVVLDNLKSFFQKDKKLILAFISRTIALHYSRELSSLSPSQCTCCLISLLAFQTLKSILFHLIEKCSRCHQKIGQQQMALHSVVHYITHLTYASFS